MKNLGDRWIYESPEDADAWWMKRAEREEREMERDDYLMDERRDREYERDDDDDLDS